MKTNTKQRGYLILIAIIIITAIAFFASTVVYMYLASTESGTKVLSVERAYYVAQSGIERATYGFLTENVACNQINATNSTFTNVSLVDGQFSVVGATNSAITTLAASVNATDMTIPVVSTVGFSANRGIAVIDQEVVLYTGLDANTLLGVIRGTNGTAAVVHSMGTNIVQNTCLLTSVGIVAGSNGSSSATLQRSVARSTGLFIVGNNGLILRGGSNFWTNVRSGTTANLNDVFMRTTSDGWVVGDVSGGQSTILHWNGTNFSRIANPGITNLRGVYFDWIDTKNFTDKHQIGMIAQEVEKVVPELVNTSLDGIKSVNYSQITALLIEAIKEQNIVISNLKSDVEILKQKKTRKPKTNI